MSEFDGVEPTSSDPALALWGGDVPQAVKIPLSPDLVFLTPLGNHLEMSGMSLQSRKGL